MPKLLSHVIEYFYSIKTSKEEQITYQEIKAWSELTKTELSPVEVQAIRRLDLTHNTI